MDGVTTALEMEVGGYPVSPWYAARKGKALIDFGASGGHLPARVAVMHDTGALPPRDKAARVARRNSRPIPAGAEKRTALYVHGRNGGPVEPGALDALQEVIADAAATGASLHVVHITGMCLSETPQCLGPPSIGQLVLSPPRDARERYGSRARRRCANS